MATQTMNNLKRGSADGGENKPVANFPAVLEKFKGEIARALPKHLNADTIARCALTCFRTTPALAKCDPYSIFAAVLQASQMGLAVGLNGEAHLVPFKGKCQLIPGYQGLMKLARQSGHVVDIYAHDVRRNDVFTLRLGLERGLTHEPLTEDGGFPASDEARGPVIGYYAVGVLKDGSRTFVAMGIREIEKIRDDSAGYKSAMANKRESTWNTNPVAMGQKTAIRRLCKYLPKSQDLITALAMDDAAERGKDQGMDMSAVIDGSYTPVVDEETGEIETDGDGTQSTTSTPATQSNGSAAAPATAAASKPAATVVGAPSTQKQGVQNPSTTSTPLGNVITKMKQATSLEALDEVYVRAEGNLSTNDLDEALKVYRARKAEIANGDIFS